MAVVAAILAALSSQARADGPSTDLPPAQGMLVLRNGEVIEGQIAKVDGLYIVDLARGRIRVNPRDVELVCANLDEAYRSKRATIQIGNVHDHLSLAQWCLRHNLLGPTSVELADAAAADPKNPMVAALQHRLKMAMEPPPVSRRERSTVASGPSNDDLDRMLRGMPRGSVETFTHSVQPVLMNHCATSGCHGPQSESGLRLSRVSSGAPMSRRTTQRNLYSAIKYIDVANPEQSRLLLAATRPHATVPHAILTERDAAQYQHLLDWANQLSGRPKQEPAASRTRSQVADVTEPMFGGDSPEELPKESRQAQHLGTADRRKTGRRNPAAAKNAGDATPASFNEPADPHDPEVFNRVYGRDKPKQDSPPSGR